MTGTRDPLNVSVVNSLESGLRRHLRSFWYLAVSKSMSRYKAT